MVYAFLVLSCFVLFYKRVRIDKLMGYVEWKLPGHSLMFVWGWRGNCYGRNRVLRIDLNEVETGIHTAKVTFINRRNRETIFWLYRVLRPWTWTWNSEWIAERFGDYNDCESGQTYYVYSGWLGQHQRV